MSIKLNFRQSSITLLACCAVFASTPMHRTFGVLAPASDGLVFDPPSNVRVKPNGKILCSITTKKRIAIWNDRTGGEQWYATQACGTKGYIHRDQIRDIKSYD